MDKETSEKTNIHAGLAKMDPETPEEYEARLDRETEEHGKILERIHQLNKEGKSVVDEFPHLRY